MTESLQVTFKLLDQVSPALRQIDRGLGGTVRSLKDVDTAMKKLGRAELRQSIATQTDPLKKYKAALSLVREELEDKKGASMLGQLKSLGSTLAGPWGIAAAAVTALGAAVGAATLGVGAF